MHQLKHSLQNCPVRNLGVILDQNLSFSSHITHLSRSCFMHIRDVRRIRPILDLKTASTIPISVVHAKLDYCNSLFLNIHSFIPAISIAPLQVLYHSEALPTTARILYRSFTPKRTG